jgi:UDP-N-acetylglucosamine 2-epimerase (non-hydrolysing)
MARRGVAATVIAHVVGARPNFPKAAPVLAALAGRGIQQTLIHTGQHYDERLSGVFFAELGLPEPDVDLRVGSGSHAVQTATAMVELEKVFRGRSDIAAVVVYGDVNSTLAAALVAAKLRIPVAHVEAGLRSFDPAMPEEINRRVVDQLSDLLFTTSPEANSHLAGEGIAPGAIHFVGNPMIDTLLAHLDDCDGEQARARSGADDLRAGGYLVATLHRPANVDDPATVRELVAVLREVSARIPLVLPLHPRGRAALARAGLSSTRSVRICEPLGYTVFLGLVRDSAGVITDSGGLQEETTVMGVPCLTLRTTTERPVTITHGTNRLIGPRELPAAVEKMLTRERSACPVPPSVRPPWWDGTAGPRIAAILTDWVSRMERSRMERSR